MSAVASWVKAMKVAALIVAFSIFHVAFHIIDLTIIWALRYLVAMSTKLFGWPRQGVFASAAPPVRTSQVERSIYVHAQDRTLASTRFGWPVVITEEECTQTYKVSAPTYTNHVSTILANFKPVADIHYRREIIQSFDGCDLAVDWADPEDNMQLREGVLETTLDIIAAVAKNRGYIDTVFSRFGLPPSHPYDIAKQAPRVLSIVPGLLSDSGTTYIRSFVRVALSHGFTVAVVHTRGIATPLTRPKMFHGGLTDDVRFWCYNHLTHEALQRRFGRRAHAVVVGFSLGANILAKFLAEDGDLVAQNSAVIAASAVSAPWRFHDVTNVMSRWIQKKTYDSEFLGGLKHYITYNKILRDPVTGKGVGFDFDKAIAGPDVPSIDANVVVPHHGFRDCDDYYTRASCFPILHQVTLPLCCVGVADDPICGPPSNRRRVEDCVSKDTGDLLR